MSFADFAVSITRGSAGILGDTVTLYPVRAASVGAFLGSDGEGTSIVGVFDRRPELNEDGRVDNLEDVFSTDDTTAASIVLRESSIGYQGRLYDVVRKLPEHPGAVECYLEEYR